MSKKSAHLQGVLIALQSLTDEISEMVYVARPDARRTPLFASGGLQSMLGYTPEEWRRDPEVFWNALHPSDRRGVEQAYANWDRRRPLQLRYRLRAQDGRHVFCRDTASYLAEGPAGPQVQGIISDVTELQVLQDSLGAVVGAVDPKLSVAIFCDGLAAMMGVERAGFVDARTLDGARCTYGSLAERTGIEWVRHAKRGTLAEDAAREGVSALVTPPAEALPDGTAADAAFAFAFAATVHGVDRRARGFLWGAGKRTRPLDGREKRIIEAVARQASLALQRSDLVAELERIGAERQRLAESAVLAHEDERRRIASELHDGAGQTLMASVIQIDLALNLVQGPPVAKKALETARGQVEQTLEDLRGLAHALRPAALDKLGLPDALREMGRALASGALSLDVDVPPTAVKLEPEVSTAIFRIAQAALTNVARHAKARSGVLRLEVDETLGRVVLEVEDDGRGFKAAPLVQGIGLVAMRERAHHVGGELTVEDRPGGGTRVRAEIPLTRRG